MPLGVIFQQILSEDVAFGLIIRLPTHGPRIIGRIIPFARSGSDEKLRHLAGVHVFLNCGIRRRSKTLKDQKNSIVLDELVRGLDSLRWIV